MPVAEIRRNAARGVRAVAFSELPTYLGLPSIHSGYWDPFFAGCQETGTVVCMHIGSGTKTPQTSPDAPDAVPATILFGNTVAGMTDFIFSGILDRFPSSSCSTPSARSGGSPTCSSGPTTCGRRTGGGAARQLYCAEPPSTYYYRQICSCFFKDPVGIALLDRVGPDNVIFETDYPHQDGTWPHSVEAAADQFGDRAPRS